MFDTSDAGGAPPRFYGIFDQLQRLDIFSREAVDIYDDGFADFWTRYCGQDASDIPFYQRLLPGPEARVLDLGCGSGRIGVALARGGVLVDGLERSAAMLALVEATLAVESDALRARLRFFAGDMCSFSLPDRYDLVVLGATSISLLLEPAQRLALFACVARHLRPGGKFIFDIMDFSDERWRQHDHFQDVWSCERDDGQEFAIVGQRFYPELGRFTFNVYREFIAWDGATQRTMGSSTKALIMAEELRDAAQAAGLVIADEFGHGALRYFVATGAQL